MDCSVLCCIIPGELVIAILSRLPVKSLLKFRCVCKPWNSLTRDFDFISGHLKASAAKAKEEKMMILVHNPGRDAKPYLSLHYDTGSSRKTFQVTLPFKMMKGDGYRLSIIGQCNGIVCVHGYKSSERNSWSYVTDLALFNPATKEVKVIPVSDHSAPPNFGFGYDPVTDDYKVVMVASRNKVALYSLKKNSWKDAVTDTRGLHGYNSPQVHVKGVCYWKGEDQKLVSFDMTSEEFGDLDVPLLTPKLCRHAKDVNLIVLSGHLCLIWPTPGPPNVFSLWLRPKDWWMKWKVITAPDDYYAIGKWDRPTAKYELVTVRRNGDFIMRNVYDGLLKTYNKSTRTVTPLQLDVITLEVSDVVSCKETLFQLK